MRLSVGAASSQDAACVQWVSCQAQIVWPKRTKTRALVDELPGPLGRSPTRPSTRIVQSQQAVNRIGRKAHSTSHTWPASNGEGGQQGDEGCYDEGGESGDDDYGMGKERGAGVWVAASGIMQAACSGSEETRPCRGKE